MSYFEEWQNRIEDTSNPEAYNDFVQKYYQLEQNAYDQVLQKGSAEISGVASEIAVELGFADDMVIFTGFLDGIQTSLKNTVDLASVADDTTIDLKLILKNFIGICTMQKLNGSINLTVGKMLFLKIEEQKLPKNTESRRLYVLRKLEEMIHAHVVVEKSINNVA